MGTIAEGTSGTTTMRPRAFHWVFVLYPAALAPAGKEKVG
jgi:hypothetical protein